MVQRVHIFTKAIRQEFVSGYIDRTAPREFTPAGSSSTFPQRKAKGKAKARTLTSTEMAERRSKRARTRSNAQGLEPLQSPATTELIPSMHNETQDCIPICYR